MVSRFVILDSYKTLVISTLKVKSMLLCSRVVTTDIRYVQTNTLLQVAPQVPSKESEVYRSLYTRFKIYSLEN